MSVIFFIIVGFAIGMGIGNALEWGAASIVPALLGGLVGFWLEAWLLHNDEGMEYRRNHRR